MKNKPYRFRHFPSRENIFGKLYDFFLMLDIKRSNLFKAVGRKIEAFLAERQRKT